MFSPRFHMKELSPEKESPQKKVTSLAAVYPLLVHAWSRASAGRKAAADTPSTGSDSTPAPSIQITSPSNQSPYSGSVAQGTAKPEVVSLTFQDAIDLGLKNNLGVLLQSYNTIAARGREMERTERASPQRQRRE